MADSPGSNISEQLPDFRRENKWRRQNYSRTRPLVGCPARGEGLVWPERNWTGDKRFLQVQPGTANRSYAVRLRLQKLAWLHPSVPIWREPTPDTSVDRRFRYPLRANAGQRHSSAPSRKSVLSGRHDRRQRIRIAGRPQPARTAKSVLQ